VLQIPLLLLLAIIATIVMLPLHCCIFSILLPQLLLFLEVAFAVCHHLTYATATAPVVTTFADIFTAVLMPLL